MKVVLFLTSLCLFFNSPNGELPNESCPKDGCPDQLEDELKNLDQADPRLFDIVRKKFLVPPPSPARQKSDLILHFCFKIKTRSLQHSLKSTVVAKVNLNLKQTNSLCFMVIFSLLPLNYSHCHLFFASASEDCYWPPLFVAHLMT